MTRLVLISLFVGTALLAQGPNSGPLTPDRQPDLQTLSRVVRILGSRVRLDEATSGRVEQLTAAATAARAIGHDGEARRALAEAQAVVSGQEWSDRDAFVWSLALTLDRTVLESTLSLEGELGHHYMAEFRPKSGLRLSLSLAPMREGVGHEKELGSYAIKADGTFAFEESLARVADGYYELVATVADGNDELVELKQVIALAEGIILDRTAIERRLAQIEGHESAKATVRWPYDLARVVNEGKRGLNSGDFGLGVDGTRDFPFAKEMKESKELLSALEAGKAPLTRAKGDVERHYWFAEGLEVMPYRVYTPSTWDGKSQLPMVFVLHGNTRDHDFYFDRDDGTLWKMAEKYGYLVATTMGYRPSAGYNADAQRKTDEPRRFPMSAKQQRETRLSEIDAMNAFELIVDEYNPDPSRIYVFGHSSGATGGWYVGEKYNDKWAGIALSAFTTRPQDVDYDVFENTPLMMIVGSKDGPRRVEMVGEMVDSIRSHGLETEHVVIEGADHDTIVGRVLPRVFEFFDELGKK